MQKVFGTPDGMGSVRVELKKDVIGGGRLGAKSAALRAYRPLFESLERQENGIEKGLVYLPHISITPTFLSEFLKRTGASYDKPEQAIDAIDRGNFSSSELDGFKEAVAPFANLYVTVRSDEGTASGVGLWHTDFMLVGDPIDSTSRIAHIIKEVLKADFSRDVLAFKRRIGLPIEENPGVFVMPVVGYNIRIMPPPIYGTPYHANVITSFAGDDALVNVGIGIGGANNEGANTSLLTNLNGFHFNPRFLPGNSLSANVLYDGALTNSGSIKGGQEHLESFLGGIDEIVSVATEELRWIVAAIPLQSKTPLYLEFGLQISRWSVLQCAEAKLDLVTKPDIADSQKILNIRAKNRGHSIGTAQFGARVSGRKVMKTEHIVYVDQCNSRARKALSEINKTLTNYVLIIGGDSGFYGLANRFSFADYSNAAAIVCLYDDPLHNAASHFNGTFREVGIPILAGDVKRQFLQDLKPNEVNDKKLLVYANDAIEEGFVSVL